MSLAKKLHISYYRQHQLKYLLVDILTAELIWISFLIFRWLVINQVLFSVDNVLIPAFNFYPPLIIYPLACIVIYYLTGYYIRPFNKNAYKELLQTLVAAFIISIGAFFVIIIDDDVTSYNNYYISLLVLFVFQFTICYIPRMLITQYTKYLYRKKVLTYNSAIIGNTEAANNLAKQHPEKNIVKIISPDEINNIADIKKQYKIDEVIIAAGKDIDENRLYRLIEKIYPIQVQISFPARTYDILVGAARIDSLSTNPLVVITDIKMADWEICCKRAFDILVSSLCLALLSPLYVVIALLIKIDSKGPIIYKQERTGLYGNPFNILKFRTMQIDAEGENPQLSQINDPRITHIGHYLRKYRIDELPQFWNVLRGDMSIVGPRPERAYYIEKIVERAPYYYLLYKIRPGLTSWGPIRVGYTDTIDKMIQRLNYDMAYIENMSLRLDLKIILYTFKVIFDGKGQ